MRKDHTEEGQFERESAKEVQALTDWISIIDSDYERIVQVRNRRSKTVTVTIVAILSIISLGWGLIRQYDLTWQDLVNIAPWWVAVNFLFMAVSVLYSVYLRVHLPGIVEQIAEKQKRPMLTPEGVVKSLTFILMAIGSAIAVWKGLPSLGALLFGFIFVSMFVSGLFVIFNVNASLVLLKAAKWTPDIQERIKRAAKTQHEFTSALVATFFLYSLTGLLLIAIVWDSDIWPFAIQASFLLSAFIVAVNRNLQEFGRITLADKALSEILDLRVRVLTDKTLKEDAIASEYRIIFGR